MRAVEMKKTKKEWLDRSYEWIRTHLAATNLDVPHDLVEEWIVEDQNDGPKPRGFHFAIFAYGYLQREIAISDLPASEAHSVPVTLLLDRFERWQIKLALAEVHRATDVNVEPAPLFTFTDEEEIRYWPKRKVP
jgi:hypothetical protein